MAGGVYDIGTARGTIEISAASLGRAIAGFDALSKAMLATGAVAVAAFGYAVKSAADFEQQVSRLKAVGSVSEDQMEKIRQKALQLGRDSAYGASEVIKAFTELAYAGASTHEIISGLGDATVYLAAAGEIPLADAATTLINVLRQYNIPAEKAKQVTNEIARAANASTITVGDLTTSLRYAGSVSAVAGISFNSTAEAIAILGNNGIRGSTAGTTLRGVIVSLTKPSQQATDKMRELGLITLDGANQFFKANGEMKSYAQIAQVLQDHTKNLTDEQKLNALGVIFQRRAMAGAAVLARDGKKAFDDLTGSQQYNTTAQQIMKEKLDNLNGSLKILKASLETAAIVLGEKFQGPLKAVSDGLRDVTNWFIKLNPKIQEGVGWALFGFGSFLLLGGSLAFLAKKTLLAYKAFVNLGEGLGLIQQIAGSSGFLLTPLGLIVIALILIGLVAFATYKLWDKIWTAIKDHPAYAAIILALLLIAFPIIFIGLVVGALAKNWRTIWEHIKAWTLEAVAAIKVAWQEIKGAATDVANWVKNAWKDVETAFKNFLTWLKTDFVNFFTSLPGRIQVWMGQAAQAFITTLQNLPLYIAFVLGLMLGLFIRFFANLWVWAIQGLTFLVQLFGQILGQLIPWLIQFGFQILTTVLTWITDLIANLPGWLLQVTQKFFEWAMDIAQQLPGWFLSWWERFINLANDLENWAIDTGLRILQKTGDWAIQMGPRIFQFIASIPGDMLNFALNMLGQFLAGLGIGVGGIDNFFSELPGRITGALGGLAAAMWGMGWQAINGFFQGLQSIAGHIENWAENFAKSIVKKITDPLGIFSPSRVLRDVGQNVMLGLLQGLERTAPLVLSQMGDTANMIAGFSPVLTGYSGAGGFNIDTVKIEVHGVSDPNQARAAGAAAAEGFSDALARKQVQTTARML